MDNAQRTEEMEGTNTSAGNDREKERPEEEPITGKPRSELVAKAKAENAKHIFVDSVVRKDVIHYNDSFAGVVVNFLLGLVRTLIFLPTVFHVATLIGYFLQVYMLTDIDGNPLQEEPDLTALVRLAVEVPVTALILFDCTAAGGVAMHLGTYEDRMKLARFAYLFGYYGHRGLIFVRLMLWSVLLIAMQFNVLELVSVYRRILHSSPLWLSQLRQEFTMQQLILLVCSPDGLIVGIALYLGITAAVLVGEKFYDEEKLANPWLEPYPKPELVSQSIRGTLTEIAEVENPQHKPILSKTLKMLRKAMMTALALANAAYLAAIGILLFVYTFAQEDVENWEGFSMEHAKAFSSKLLLLGICGVLGANYLLQTYMDFRSRPRRLTVMSLAVRFLATMWLFHYAFMIVISGEHEKGGELDPWLELLMELASKWKLVLAFSNVMLAMLSSPTKAFNGVMWCVKYGTTVSMIVMFFSVLACTLPVLGGMIGAQGLGKDMFTMEIEWAQVLQLLSRVFQQVFDTIGDILKPMTNVLDVISIAMSPLLCWIVILALVATVLALVAIGFALGIIPEIGLNLAKVMDAVKKLFNLVKGFAQPLKTARQFTVKGLNVVRSISSSGPQKFALGFPLFVVLYQDLLRCLPVVLGVAILMYVVFERQSQFPALTHAGVALALIFLLFMNLGVLLLLDWMFSQEYDMVILRVRFSRGWGLIWAQHGHVIAIAGVLAYVVCYLISPTHGDNELEEKPHMRFPGLLPCLCPLLDPPREVDPKGSFFKLFCYRTCPCCDPNRHNTGLRQPLTFFTVFMEVMFPCFFGLSDDDESPTYLALTCDACFPCNVQDKGARRCAPERVCCCCYPRRYKELMKNLEKQENKDETELIEEMDDLDSSDGAQFLEYNAQKRSQSSDEDEPEDQPPNPSNVDRSRPDSVSLRISRDSSPHEVSDGNSRGCIYDPSKLQNLPSFLIPIVLSAFSLFLVWRSMQQEWLKFETTSGTEFQKLIVDNGPSVAQSQVVGGQEEESGVCPPLELATMLMSALGSEVLGFLKPFFQPFYTMVQAMIDFASVLADLPIIDLFEMATKLIFQAPSVASAAITVGGSVLVAQSEDRYITRLTFLRFSFLLALYGMQVFLFFPFVVNGVLGNIPFVDLKMIQLQGYDNAVLASQINLVACVALIVDNYFPPIAPKMPDDFYDELANYEESDESDGNDESSESDDSGESDGGNDTEITGFDSDESVDDDPSAQHNDRRSTETVPKTKGVSLYLRTSPPKPIIYRPSVTVETPVVTPHLLTSGNWSQNSPRKAKTRRRSALEEFQDAQQKTAEMRARIEQLTAGAADDRCIHDCTEVCARETAKGILEHANYHKCRAQAVCEPLMELFHGEGICMSRPKVLKHVEQDHDCHASKCVDDFHEDVLKHLKFHENAKPFVCSELHALFHGAPPSCEAFQQRHICTRACVDRYVHVLREELAKHHGHPLEHSAVATSSAVAGHIGPPQGMYCERLVASDVNMLNTPRASLPMSEREESVRPQSYRGNTRHPATTTTAELIKLLHSQDHHCGCSAPNEANLLRASSFSGAFVHDCYTKCTEDCLKHFEKVLREHMADHESQGTKVCDKMCIKLHTKPGDVVCRDDDDDVA